MNTVDSIIQTCASKINKSSGDPVLIKRHLMEMAGRITLITDTSSGTYSVDLDTLFSPPTTEEITALITEWGNRDTLPTGVTTEKTGTIGGLQCTIFSHVTSEGKHYGLVRYPTLYVSGNKYPALIWCHGGFNGIDCSVIGWFDSKFLSSTYFRDHYFYILPSYRGEALMVPAWGTWISEGQKSKADWDVDDAIALSRILESEISNRFWYGQSRGGTVALLATIRGYATKTAELFGGADCYRDYIRADIEKYLYRNVIPTEKISTMVLQEAVLPLLWGQIDMPTARLEMLRRSPAYFASTAAPSSLHHGLIDPLVDWIQTQYMESALTSAGIVHEAEYYQNGIHDPDTLPGCGAKVEAWLQ